MVVCFVHAERAQAPTNDPEIPPVILDVSITHQQEKTNRIFIFGGNVQTM
jgi:hypothetical protein